MIGNAGWTPQLDSTARRLWLLLHDLDLYVLVLVTITLEEFLDVLQNHF